MAKTKEILVNGQLTPVTEFDYSAQEIDDAVKKANNAFPIDGSRPLNGDLYIQKLNNGRGQLVKVHGSDYDYGTVLSDITADLKVVELAISGNTNIAYFKTVDGVYHAMFHTGNKPAGIYTGNGSAAERVIDLGGLHDNWGSWCGLWGGANEMAIACWAGAFYKSDNSVAFTPDITYTNGILKFKTATILNTNGYGYQYCNF